MPDRAYFDHTCMLLLQYSPLLHLLNISIGMKLFILTWNSVTCVNIGTLTVKQGIKHEATQNCTHLSLVEDMYSTDDAQSTSLA